MRKILWTIPMAASIAMGSTVGPILSRTGSVSAATRTVQDESAKWLNIDRAHKMVTVKVTADATDENGGRNFDGYSKGAMQVKVPQGWKVQFTFKNNNTVIPHSLMVVPYPQRTLESGFKTAFPGASTISPTQGITKGVTQSFHFTATKSGTFAMICGVPGHSEGGGMWDTFIVSSKLKMPSVVVTEDNSSSGYGNGY